MRKIIWGIAIVFCMQVAFQLAMTANRSDADYAALRTPLQNGIDISTPAPDAYDLDTNIAPVDAEPQIERSPIQTNILIRYIAVPEYRRSSERDATTAAFKPIVITYDRTGALTGPSNAQAERRSPAKPELPSDDKRSLIAKVVTKPYDWLKAVGSKLR